MRQCGRCGGIETTKNKYTYGPLWKGFLLINKNQLNNYDGFIRTSLITNQFCEINKKINIDFKKY
jgi:hypothetical protein